MKKHAVSQYFIKSSRILLGILYTLLLNTPLKGMRIMHEWGLSEELKIQTKQMIEIAEKNYRL